MGAQMFDEAGVPRMFMLYQDGFESDFFANRFGDDRDFYRYDLVAGQTLVAETSPVDGPTWPRDTDMYMELYAADGSLLADNDDGGFDWHSKIEYTADTDRSVYVVVRSQDYTEGTDRDPTRAEYKLIVTTDTEISDPVAAEGEELPESFSVSENYPNPFNPSTTFHYSLPQTVNVDVAVFDMLGKRVQTITQGQQSAGTYTVRFDASSLASGMYFYQVRAGEFIQTRKMLLLK